MPDPDLLSPPDTARGTVPLLRARMQVLAATVLWSTSGAAVKLSGLSGWQLSFGRSAIATAVLLLVLPGARRRLSRRALLVALAYAATVVLFMLATRATTAANAIFLQDTAPLYVLLLSPLLLSPLLLGERPSRGELLAAPIFLAGLGLFFLDRLAPGQLAGNLVALASGVAFALTIVGFRAARGEGDAVLVWGNLFAALLSAPLALGGPEPTAGDLAIVAFLGVIQLALPYALFHRGLAHTPATEASLLVLLEPVLNPLWAYLLVGERPGPWALAGGAVILGATVWRTTAAARGAAAAIPASN